MEEWFRTNFEDPADSLPYDGREGGYQWLWGGPYFAVEEIADAFPGVDDEELAEAATGLDDEGVSEWTVASWRLARVQAGQPPYEASFGERRLPPVTDRRAYTVVETTLLPKVTWQWSVHATFVPGDTNQPLGEEADDDRPFTEESSGFRFDASIRRFGSLREMVVGLIELELVGSAVGGFGELEASRDWVLRLESDGDLFVDDAIVVHASPPAWMPLAKLVGSRALDAGSVTAIIVSTGTPLKAAGYLLAYGGARIFIRLVHGVEFLQDAVVERLGERIRRGDFDAGAASEPRLFEDGQRSR